MICKSFIDFNLSFKLKIDFAFVKKNFKARKTLGNFEILIRGKTFIEAFAKVVNEDN